MSKLAALKQARGVGDPAILGVIGKFLGKKLLPAAGKLLGIGKKGAGIVPYATAPLIKTGAKIAAGGAAFGAGTSLAEQLMGGGAAGAQMYRRRRAKGITATELRGFRKVANLLRKVGMVPKGTRRKR